VCVCVCVCVRARRASPDCIVRCRQGGSCTMRFMGKKKWPSASSVVRMVQRLRCYKLVGSIRTRSSSQDV